MSNPFAIGDATPPSMPAPLFCEEMWTKTAIRLCTGKYYIDKDRNTILRMRCPSGWDVSMRRANEIMHQMFLGSPWELVKFKRSRRSSLMNMVFYVPLILISVPFTCGVLSPLLYIEMMQNIKYLIVIKPRDAAAIQSR